MEFRLLEASKAEAGEDDIPAQGWRAVAEHLGLSEGMLRFVCDGSAVWLTRLALLTPTDEPPPEGTEDPLARKAPMAMCSYPVVNLVSESRETSKFKGQVRPSSWKRSTFGFSEIVTNRRKRREVAEWQRLVATDMRKARKILSPL